MSNNPSLGRKAARGAMWASADRFGTMALQFTVNLVLAWRLMPADFGAVGMLAIFIAVSTVIIDGGFTTALIQKKEPTQTDYSTILYWNLLLALIIYGVLFACAPLIARFFKMPVLCGVMRGIGLSLPLQAVIAVQIARLRKQLRFSAIAAVNLTSHAVAGAVAILLAYNGAGVWSLVAMQLMAGGCDILILAIITRWHPSLCFSRESMRELFGFGGYIFASNLLQETCKNVQGLIIGRRFSATQMGYYSQAQKLDTVTSYSLPQVIVQVMYPVYSSLQDERERLVGALTMNIRVISFVIFPLLGMLIVVAEPLIMWLYGLKWMPAVPYYQILCVGGMFVCLQNVNFYAVAACGYSKVLFRWALYKWSFLLAALLVSSRFGMSGIMWAMVLSSFNIYMVNACLVHRHVGLRLTAQLRAVMPPMLAVAAGYGAAMAAGKLPGIPPAAAGAVFAAVYLLCAPAMRAAGELRGILRNIIK